MKLKKRLRRYQLKETEAIPEYSLEEEPARRFKIPKRIKRLLGITIIVGVILYIPPILFHEIPQTDRARLKADTSAILMSNQYLKDNPDVDFDGDGLNNEEETRRNSDPYRIDSDGDGITDYAEIYLTETNPTVYNRDILPALVTKQLEETAKTVQSPYKVNNVVMWPKDIEARSRGTVVRTLNGYRFCNFTGWAQFPEGDYVYQIEEGIHIELKRNGEGAVCIPGPNTTVEAYASSLDMVYDLQALGHSVYLENDILGNILSFLLPSHGPALFSCRKIASVDLDPDVRKNTVIDPKASGGEYGMDRFGRNHIMLSDLTRVRESINKGEPVLASLFSQDNGEACVLVYGYTADGDLLIADKDTLEEVGLISIEERASLLYDQSGTITQYEWFAFSGLGYSSQNRDRISFFSVVVT